LRRALAFDKEGRPADVEAFLEELHASVAGVAQAVLDAVPTGATQPATENPTRTSNQRKSGVRSSIPSMPAAAGAASSSRPIFIGAGVGLLVVAGLVGAFFAMRTPAGPEPIAVVVPPPAAVVSKPQLSANVAVHVESDPPGAQLLNGATPLGVSPANLVLPRSLGAVNLSAKLAGYLPQTQGVDLSAAGDAPVTLSFKLAADPAAKKPEEKLHGKSSGKHAGGKVDVPIFE
jgi:hypothetical protein